MFFQSQLINLTRKKWELEPSENPFSFFFFQIEELFIELLNYHKQVKV